ncbi:MAG TPA: TerC family protein [Nitrospirota bacterium]|nr:TerC family protein [Nitrospirota bacterium]
MEWLTNPQAWIALITLTALEIVLGIDNIIFISILVGKLPHKQRNKTRILGLGLAMITRIILLLSITWVMKLTSPLFRVFTQGISGRDIILIIGGLFLLWKSTREIHDSLEGEEAAITAKIAVSFLGILTQIALLDIIFSLDSVITAVGLVKDVAVMILAIVIAIIVMMFSSGAIGDFVEKHPTIKILALSFLVMIGVTLIAEGFEFHIPRGYIYFAMAFSVTVEMLNIKMRKRSAHPVKLHKVDIGKSREMSE